MWNKNYLKTVHDNFNHILRGSVHIFVYLFLKSVPQKQFKSVLSGDTAGNSLENSLVRNNLVIKKFTLGIKMPKHQPNFLNILYIKTFQAYLLLLHFSKLGSRTLPWLIQNRNRNRIQIQNYSLKVVCLNNTYRGLEKI